MRVDAIRRVRNVPPSQRKAALWEQLRRIYEDESLSLAEQRALAREVERRFDTTYRLERAQRGTTLGLFDELESLQGLVLAQASLALLPHSRALKAINEAAEVIALVLEASGDPAAPRQHRDFHYWRRRSSEMHVSLSTGLAERKPNEGLLSIWEWGGRRGSELHRRDVDEEPLKPEAVRDRIQTLATTVRNAFSEHPWNRAAHADELAKAGLLERLHAALVYLGVEE